jgi:hypothetical protein
MIHFVIPESTTERKRKERLAHFVMPEFESGCSRMIDHILKNCIVKIIMLQECSLHHVQEKT